ncbi:MAG: DUF2182 domain-containing protein [SAR324 cluster bacterium]|nr:DUF2182 domain-containing protein [SAR324 cluster bacterium]
MPMHRSLEKVLQYDRWVIIALLVTVTISSWLFIIKGAGTGMSAAMMTGIDLATGGGMRMPAEMPSWTFAYAIIMFFMWWIMMIAMMLPSASPTILLFARARHDKQETDKAHLPSTVFASGYLLAWADISAIAVIAQWALEGIQLLNKMMVSTSPVLGGALLLVAGLWQFTPWKHACLRHCRSPLIFLMTRWRPGLKGALIMGIDHGSFCLGCCWFLMALLFFGGIMNLWWIGGLALYVLAEKTLPSGHWVGYGFGLILVVWGGWMMISV